MLDPHLLGQEGERLAADYLSKKENKSQGCPNYPLYKKIYSLDRSYCSGPPEGSFNAWRHDNRGSWICPYKGEERATLPSERIRFPFPVLENHFKFARIFSIRASISKGFFRLPAIPPRSVMRWGAFSFTLAIITGI